MNRVFLFFYLMLWTFAMHSQEICGSTFSPDPDFDFKVFQEFKQAYKTGIRSSVEYLPLKIHIIRHDDQSGGFDPNLVEETIEVANENYFDMGIQFELCGGISFIDKNILYDFDRDRYLDTLIQFNEPDVINVYYINKVISDDENICGFASFPWYDEEYVVLKNSCAVNGSTLSHELGHYFGIYHTHSTTNGEELVDGSNCVFAGDGFCDTPADPRLRSSTVDKDCNYTGTSRDLNGDKYDPDPTNIMSYSRKECRTYFSPEQLEKMKFYQESSRGNLESCALNTSIRPIDPNQISVFPNPVISVLNIKNIALETIDEVYAVNILGQRMRLDYFPGRSIDLANLITGSYYILFVTEDAIYYAMIVKK